MHNVVEFDSLHAVSIIILTRTHHQPLKTVKIISDLRTIASKIFPNRLGEGCGFNEIEISRFCINLAVLELLATNDVQHNFNKFLRLRISVKRTSEITLASFYSVSTFRIMFNWKHYIYTIARIGIRRHVTLTLVINPAACNTDLRLILSSNNLFIIGLLHNKAYQPSRTWQNYVWTEIRATKGTNILRKSVNENNKMAFSRAILKYNHLIN